MRLFVKSAKEVARRIKRSLRSSRSRARDRKDLLAETHIAPHTHFFAAMSQLRPAIVEIGVERARWKSGRMAFGSRHPFVQAVKAGAGSDKPEKIMRPILERYYGLVQPNSCAEIVEPFVRDRESAFPLSTHNPPWPWNVPRSMEEPERSPVMLDDKIEFLPADEVGVQHWGPVSPEKLETEIIKLSKLLQSIREHGYVPRLCSRDGHIRGYVLRKGEEWVFMIQQGQHRFAVLSALDYRRIPVRIDGVLDHADARYFPGVVSGLYTLKEAQEQVTRMIAGTPIPALTPWLSHTRR